MKKGFTLIELLVVISIISLLSSVVFASLNSARLKARDTRRKQDLRQINLALALYYDTNGSYPIISRWATSESTTYDAGPKWAVLQTALAPYLSKLPNDPLGTGNFGPWSPGSFHYAYSSDGVLYDLVTRLENTSDPARCAVNPTIYYQGEAPVLPGGSFCPTFDAVGQMYGNR